MRTTLLFAGWTVLLAAHAAPSAWCAQESAPTIQETPQTPTADADEAARLLILKDGSVLRTRARQGSSGWEVPVGKNEWRAVGEGVVVRAILERDALLDAKRLEQQLLTGPRQEQNTRRVGLAEWMVKQGLVSEALQQLDKVFTADPDQRQALQLMTSLAPRVGIGPIDDALASEEPVVGVLRTAANGSPTVREIAIQRLSSTGASDELRAELRAQLASHSPRMRALAAHALRRIYPGMRLRTDDVRELISRSVLDSAEEVRIEAARALRDVQDEGVSAPVVRALNSANPRVRENSIQALGTMGYPATVEPLMTYLGRLNTAMQSGATRSGVGGGSIFIGKQTAYIQDFDVEVANSASAADPQINVLVEGSVLDARVLGYSIVSYASESRVVRSSLSSLIGKDLGNTNREWLSWWELNKHSWNRDPKASSGTTAAKSPAPSR